MEVVEFNCSTGGGLLRVNISWAKSPGGEGCNTKYLQ